MSEEKEKKEIKTNIITFRIVSGRERSLAAILESHLSSRPHKIKAIVLPEIIKGYMFVETEDTGEAEFLLSGVKDIKGRVPGRVDSGLEDLLVPKSIIDTLNPGDEVEIIGGPFRGMRATIQRIIKPRDEVILLLKETEVPVPITVHVDYVKKVKSGEK